MKKISSDSQDDNSELIFLKAEITEAVIREFHAAELEPNLTILKSLVEEAHRGATLEDEPLAFGSEAIDGMIVAAVWSSVGLALAKIGKGTIESVSEGILGLVKRKIGRLFGKKTQTPALPLSEAQTRDLVVIVRGELRRAGLESARSELIAHAVVGRIALRSRG